MSTWCMLTTYITVSKNHLTINTTTGTSLLTANQTQQMPWIYQSPRALCQASSKHSINTPWIGCTVTHKCASGIIHYLKDQLLYFRVTTRLEKKKKNNQECFLISVLQITLQLNEINSQLSKNQFFKLSFF